MPHLLPNTIPGLIFGMSNFDAIELDIRLTKDEGLALYHDPILQDGRNIRNLTLEEYKQTGFPTFEDFLINPEVQKLAKQGRKVFVELKPDCSEGRSIHHEIAPILHSRFHELVDDSGIDKNALMMLSFQKVLLEPFAKENEYPVYPILPYISECNNQFTLLKALPRILRKSLKSHIYDAVEKNYTGVTFARQFFMGFTKYRHPNYDKLCDLMDETGVQLGTNLGDKSLESSYPKFIRVTDQTSEYPRHAKPGEGLIVAHRGTGTKGVTVEEKTE
ncbi:MAG: hypothetical protein INQ03_05280 [Candidatus Heimdallarchaeota archaeon]|nr:hypothetical protein [Candidatus Heimdallarchaeota archaeon]